MICEKHNEEKVTYKSGKKECRSCNREYQASWWNKNKFGLNSFAAIKLSFTKVI